MKEKNKGFTLVELLAVIVILAIIALIATPIILNVISDAKKQATLESFKGYIDGAEKAIVLNEFADEKDTTFPKVDENGCYNLKDLDKKINIKGTKPTIADDSKACFESGVVTSITGLTFSGYEVKYTKDKGYEINGKVVEKDDKKEETIDVYKDGTKVGVTNDLKKCNIGTTNCYIGYTYGDKKGTAKLNLVIGYDANVIGSHDMEASDFYTIVGLNSSSCNYSCFTNPNASFCETSTCTKDNVIPTGYEWLYNFDYCNSDKYLFRIKDEWGYSTGDVGGVTLTWVINKNENTIESEKKVEYIHGEATYGIGNSCKIPKLVTVDKANFS